MNSTERSYNASASPTAHQSDADSICVFLNGTPHTIAPGSLKAVLSALNYDGKTVATAVNGAFVSAQSRETCIVRAGDQIEIVAPRQGG